MSFVLVFTVTLGVRLLIGDAGRASDALALDDPSAGSATVTTDVRPNEAPTQLGHLTFRNSSRSPIALTRVALRVVDPGLGVVGFVILYPSENDSMLGGQCGPFPPPNFATHPVSGSELAPGARASLVIAVRATREGEFSIDGVRVSYVTDEHRFHQDLPLHVLIRARAANPPCRFDPTPHQIGGRTT